MEDDDLIYKFDNLETRIHHLEENGNTNYDENSVVAVFLDLFNFKKFLEIVFYSQKKCNITQYFIHLVILFLFLFFIFWQNGILRFDRSSGTITLVIIFIAGVIEFLGANTSIFKKFLSTKDDKTKLFIDKLPSMNLYEIEQSIKNKNFSPICMNYFIKMLEEKGRYPSQVIYLIIDSQRLTTVNLDLLFSKKIITNLHAYVVIRVLYKSQNYLKAQHIENIHESFKSNEDVLKVLFATQKYSDSLLEIHPDNMKLKEYYNKFQLEKTYLDWKLKLFPASHVVGSGVIIFISIYLFFAALWYIVMSHYQLNTDIIPLVIITLIFLLFSTFVSFMNYFFKRYRQHYINQIIKK